MLYSKYDPWLVIHFSNFLTISEYHADKNRPLLLRIIHRAIFSHLRTNQNAAQQIRDRSMKTSGNRKKPSLVSKTDEIEVPSWVLQTCCGLVLPYVIMWLSVVVKKNNFVLPLSVRSLSSLFSSSELFKSVNCC